MNEINQQQEEGASVFCPNCGTENVSGYNFCISCGTKLPTVLLSSAPLAEKNRTPQPRSIRNWMVFIVSGIAVIIVIFLVGLRFFTHTINISTHSDIDAVFQQYIRNYCTRTFLACQDPKDYDVQDITVSDADKLNGIQSITCVDYNFVYHTNDTSRWTEEKRAVVFFKNKQNRIDVGDRSDSCELYAQRHKGG